LRNFLQQRGLLKQCVGCTEKEHLLEFALQHKDDPILPPQPPKPKTARLGETWKGKAIEACRNEQKTPNEQLCRSIGEVVASKLSEFANGIISVLKKNEQQVTKTSLTFPYVKAGETHIKNFVRSVLALDEEPDKEQIKDLFAKSKLSKWVLETAMENSQSMLTETMDLEEILRNLEKQKTEESKKEKNKEDL